MLGVGGELTSHIKTLVKSSSLLEQSASDTSQFKPLQILTVGVFNSDLKIFHTKTVNIHLNAFIIHT